MYQCCEQITVLFEDQNGIFIILRPSIVKRDLCFSFKIVVFVFQKRYIFTFLPNLFDKFQKKSIYIFLLLQICSKDFIIISMFRPNNCTFDHTTALINIIRTSFVERDLIF